MHWMLYAGIVVFVFILMEGVTWLTHRYIMHGILWSLHRDHHQKTDGFFEKNDVIIHQRFKWFTRSSNTYIAAASVYNSCNQPFLQQVIKKIFKTVEL